MARPLVNLVVDHLERRGGQHQSRSAEGVHVPEIAHELQPGITLLFVVIHHRLEVVARVVGREIAHRQHAGHAGALFQLDGLDEPGHALEVKLFCLGIFKFHARCFEPSPETCLALLRRRQLRPVFHGIFNRTPGAISVTHRHGSH